MIRGDVDIKLDEIDAADARAALVTHQRSLEWTGDDYLAREWLAGTRRRIVVDGRPVGLAVWSDAALSLLTLEREALRYDRHVMEVVLAESAVKTAFVGSWDAHHVGVFGAFATEVASQAYQFRLPGADDLVEPVPGLTLRPASEDDAPWLQSTGFLDDHATLLDRNELSIALLDGVEAGVAVHVPHPLDPDVVSIGMFVAPELRRRGVGRSILALTARSVLDEGRSPVAGCWWRNWPSRATLEAAGLVCAGTIFRLTLDPDVFVRAAGAG